MMKKLTKLTKTLLVAAGLCMGQSAWSVEYLTTTTGQIGLTDNSNGFGAYRSMSFNLKAGESYQFTLLNYNKSTSGTDEWENWAVEATDGSKFLDFRADGGYWGELPTAANYTGSVWSNISATKTEWLSAYNGVTVTLTVSRSDDGTKFVVNHTATTKAVNEIASTTYAGTYSATISSGATIDFYLTNEDSHFIIQSVNYNNTNLNYASNESAYVDAGNNETVYNGESLDKLQVYYTQFRDWNSTSDGSVKFNANAQLALYKFDLTPIKNKLNSEGGSITGVTFTIFGEAKNNAGSCDRTRILGYIPSWSSSTVTQKNLTNDGNAETLTGNVSGKGSFQPLNTTAELSFAKLGTGSTHNADALTFVKSAIDANADYVTIAITANNTRGGYFKTIANLSFTYSATVLYEATFKESNGLVPAITVYSNSERTTEVAKNALSANTTYYYTATLSGYEDYNGSFDVTTSNPTVDFTMTALPHYTFTVNAVNSVGGGVIKALFTDDESYNGKTYNVYYPAYLTSTGDVVTYSKDNSTYWQNLTSTTGDATKSVYYTAYTGNAWFYEGEDVNGATTYTTSTFAGRSSNGATGVLNAKTVASLDAGTYKITARVIGKADKTCEMYKTSTSGEKIMSITTNTTGSIGVANITLDATTDIVADGGYTTSSDNGYGFDYILIEKITSVSATLPSSGYASLASAYGLNFAGIDGLTAFVVTGITKNAVTLTSVDELPARQGVILKGTGGETYSIPVNADAAYDGTNMLQAAVEATDIEANEAYILLGGKFCLVTAASTVPAGKAYLLAEDVPSGARALSFMFGDEASGINDVVKEMQGGEFYNLSGQRVAAPKSGLYIVNGKKVIIK